MRLVRVQELMLSGPTVKHAARAEEAARLHIRQTLQATLALLVLVDGGIPFCVSWLCLLLRGRLRCRIARIARFARSHVLTAAAVSSVLDL